MKKFSALLLGAIGVILISAVTNIALNNYHPQTDEEKVCEIVDDEIDYYFNPIFTSQEEALDYYSKFVDDQITDSIIRSIPIETFSQITKVLIGRDGECDKRAILIEYLKHYNPIYKYLAPEEQDTSTEKQIDENTKIVKVEPDTTNKSNDTVINGQLYKILKE